MPAQSRIEDAPGVGAKKKLTLEQIQQLQETYRDVALADDDEAKSLRRATVARLRRVTHEELHPDCKEVEIDVPLAVDGSFFLINEKPYHGRVRVWACVACELAGMVDRNRRMDAERLREGGRISDLGTIQGRISQIQSEA